MGIFDRLLGKKNEMEKKKDVEGLINALRHKDSGVRVRAARALGKMGDARAVEPLIQALRDNAWPVRENAATTLGDIRDARAVEPLAQALKREDLSYREREKAEMALKKIRAKKS